MPLYQYQLNLQDTQEDAGWSEYVVWDGTRPNAALEAATAWAGRRARFLSNDSYVTGWGVRRIDGVRETDSFSFPAYVQGAIDEPNNLAQDCILYAFHAATGSRRPVPFRSVPDSWVASGIITAVGMGNLSLIDSYCNWLINVAQASIRINDADNEWLDINTLTNLPPVLTGGQPGNIIITASENEDLTLNEQVVVDLKGLSGYPYLRGRWDGGVNQVTPNTIIELYGSKRYNILEIGLGEYRIFSPSSTRVTSFSFTKATTRKTGSPKDRPRGKSSAKVIHRSR